MSGGCFVQRAKLVADYLLVKLKLLSEIFKEISLRSSNERLVQILFISIKFYYEFAGILRLI